MNSSRGGEQVLCEIIGTSVLIIMCNNVTPLVQVSGQPDSMYVYDKYVNDDMREYGQG